MSKSSKTGKSGASGIDGQGEKIVVTSQQSRFHADAIDAPTTKEIDVKDVTISVNGLEILDHANLRICEGVHYVFVGRNGTGKSTVLKALAQRRIPGVASNLRMLLLGQTRVSTDVEDEVSGLSSKTRTVLEHVTTSDIRREQALREAKLLGDALENKSSTKAVTQAVRQLELDQARRELAEAQLIAARRSGARGLKARQALNTQEKQVEEAEKRVSGVDVSVDEAADLQKGLEMLETVRISLEAMDAGGTEARARTVLLGLGFSQSQLEQPVTSLSGGWQTRCELACALVQQTDILMLDEPTNFLDLPAIIWLQNYVAKSLATRSVIVVTHDRDFADAVAQELLILRLVPAKTLETFKGTLTEYEQEKRRQIRRMTKMSEALDRKVKHMEDTIEKNVKAAKRTGDDKKLKQAASRRKKLDERTGLEVGVKGGRFKLNRDSPGWHLSNRSDIEIPELDPPVSIKLPDQPAPLRHTGPLVSFENVSFSYPKSGVWTLKDVSLVMHPGDRVGLVGLNGSGKSTLIKLIMGAAQGKDPRPNKGTVTIHSKARVSCYSQHAVEELERIGKLNPERTALSHLSTLAGSEMQEQDIRGMLAKLGLRGPAVSEVPLMSLSGGQRVRVALAEAVFGSPHLLILDEVTTHLDADTIIGLIEALKTWTGALLVVTHDRYFMRSVVERQKIERGGGDESSESSSDEDDDRAPGTVYRVRKAGLHKLERGMQQYEDLVEKSLAKLMASS